MIFVRDKGRMCNNMFQYMQVYAWGREKGRATMSMRFAYKYPVFAIRKKRYENYACYLFAKIMGWMHILPVVDFDKCQSLDEGLSKIESHRHCIVQGWSHIRLPDLVSKYMEEIKGLFAFDKEIKETVAHRLGSKTDIRIGVHIRRGDYSTFMNGRFMFSDSEYVTYINELVALLPETASHRVYICTNDRCLDRSYYTDNVKSSVTFSDGTGEEDLCLLSECDYVIGAVSTYSLMATLYGKARLLWLSHAHTEKKMSLEEFGDYERMSRQFDYEFV